MSTGPTVLGATTSLGPARFAVDGSLDASVVLVLGHGAGGGIESPDLAALAARLPASGITVARFEQPWRVAGKRVAPAPARLDEGWREALPQLRDALTGGPSIIAGGRSAGARVACRTAVETGAIGVLALSFPLHPPGRPEKSRIDELAGCGAPAFVVQGGRDPFGSGDEVRTALAATTAAAPVEVVDVPQGAHELVLPKRAAITDDELWDDLAARVVPWVQALGRS